MTSHVNRYIETETKPHTKQKDLSLKYGIGISTVSDIIKGTKSFKELNSIMPTVLKRLNCGKFDEVNQRLHTWYLENKAENIKITDSMLKENTMKYSQEMDIEDFKASNGWLYSWKKHYGSLSKSLTRGVKRKKTHYSLSDKLAAIARVRNNESRLSVYTSLGKT